MTIKKQTIILSVVYDEEETYGENFIASLNHEFYNLDGLMEWDTKVLEEIELTSDITDDTIEKVRKNWKGSNQ
jgi:hypothetical protein